MNKVLFIWSYCKSYCGMHLLEAVSSFLVQTHDCLQCFFEDVLKNRNDVSNFSCDLPKFASTAVWKAVFYVINCLVVPQAKP